MSKRSLFLGQQSQENRSKTSDASSSPAPPPAARGWTSFPRRDPARDLEDGARPLCAGCGHDLGGFLHVPRPEERPHPVGVCATCLGIIARAVRSRDVHQLDAAARLLSNAFRRSGVL